VRRLVLSSGSVKFVLAKVGLECFVWHPFSLFAFWVIVGGIEGHSLNQIKEELKRDYLPTLLGEFALWTPLDLLNFWLVPVKFQVLVGNCGCLVEAVCLSYIHACGFPTLPSAASRSASIEHSAQLDEGDSPSKRAGTDNPPSHPAATSRQESRLSNDALCVGSLDGNLFTAPDVMPPVESMMSSDSLGWPRGRGEPEHALRLKKSSNTPPRAQWFDDSEQPLTDRPFC